MRAYHRTGRRCLGVPNPEIDALCKAWRKDGKALGRDEIAARTELARGLWALDVHETRIAAAKLLTQARIRDDAEVWETVAGWVPEFDGWAIADHAAAAGSRRLAAEPGRLDEAEGWIASNNPWSRRAALVFALPWAKGRHPSEDDRARRDRILGWAAELASDRDRFVQKAIGWWLRTLSRHDAERVRAFDAAHGARLKPFARREALRLLDPA